MLSVCMIAKDEQQFLRPALASVMPIADEIVVGVDDRTTDLTGRIALEYGASVHPFHWQDSFADARNHGLDRARGDWVLVIDPDECLLPEGGRRILTTLKAGVDPYIDAFSTLIVEEDMHGNVLSQAWSSSRLFRGAPDLRYMGRIHEEVRYLPDPPRTYSERLEGGPHIVSFGSDPDLIGARKKRQRDRRLLRMRLQDNREDAVALCYLALMARGDGNPRRAAVYATAALNCGPRTLHDDRRAELEQLCTVPRETS